MMERLGAVLLVVAGCYHPSAEADVPCSLDGACPTGQSCVAGRCVLDGTHAIDAPAELPDDAPTDAPGDVANDAPRDAAVAPDASPDASPDAMPRFITWKATQTATVPSVGASSVTVPRPTCAVGDVLVATVAMGNTGSTQLAVFSAPSGWTLVDRINRNMDSALLVYWHVMGTLEPTGYTWQFTPQIEGVAWVSCYANVDPTTPIDAETGLVIETTGPSYAAPSVTTTTANTMLVAAWITHDNQTPTTWTSSGGTVRAHLNNGSTRAGLGIEAPVAAAGATPAFVGTASVVQDYAIVDVLALRPAP